MKQKTDSARIYKLLIDAKDIHPLFYLNVATIARKMFPTEYEENYRNPYHRRVWRAMNAVKEMALTDGFSVFGVRLPCKNNPKRFGHIRGYRILLPGEAESASLTEAIYYLQKIIDYTEDALKFDAAILKSYGPEQMKKLEEATNGYSHADNLSRLPKMENLRDKLFSEYNMKTVKVQFL